MGTDSKRLRLEIKDADRGEVTAVLATFNVIDKDDDWTYPGAFEEGASVPISSFGHSSVLTGALPAGKGTIHSTEREAILDGKFFMDTTAGRETFTVVKQLPDLEWSYGLKAIDFEYGSKDGRTVRFLKKLKAIEASPVVMGAGVGTRTLTVKQQKEGVVEYKSAIRSHSTPTTSAAWDGAAVEAGVAEDASVSDLRSVYAWVNSEEDPETKSAYRFPHHMSVGGAANLRACSAVVAVLNGGRGGSSIPDPDRGGVWSHVAGHMRDGDREPPELRSGTNDMEISDRVVAALVEVSAVIDEASRLDAEIQAKGQGLSHRKHELLGWLDDEMRRLRSVLDTPDEEAAREYVRFVGLAKEV